MSLNGRDSSNTFDEAKARVVEPIIDSIIVEAVICFMPKCCTVALSVRVLFWNVNNCIPNWDCIVIQLPIPRVHHLMGYPDPIIEW